MKTRPFILLFAVAVIIIAAGAISQDKFFVKAPKGYIFIPMGKTEIAGKTKTIQAFYMSQTEVTNEQYQEFLNNLKTKGKIKEYEIAKIDTSLWTEFDASGKYFKRVKRATLYSDIYHHKKNYPVVNISRQGAELYCKWLSEKYNQSLKTAVMEFRLPTNSEWEYAAKAGVENFPYGFNDINPYTVNETYLAQYKAFGLTNGPVAVKSFPANLWKLYDMSGNVAEMISDTNAVKGGSWDGTTWDIMIQSYGQYSVCPMVGFRPIMTFTAKKD